MTQNFNPHAGLTEVVDPKNEGQTLWADDKQIAEFSLTKVTDLPKAAKGNDPAPAADETPPGPGGADPSAIKRGPPKK